MAHTACEYEMTAGLETHAELSTETKIFCGCSTAFGGEPNTRCCPVCMGMPGVLPSLNRRAVEFAVLAGLAVNCTINLYSRMDRKNYSYPDLPKAYQITQFDLPICENGWIRLRNGQTIRIRRIHIEEDAGKLIREGDSVRIDYNRCGVPLIEIVTEPDIRSPEEAREYVEELQKILRYLGVSDCRMQEGSLRCDVNLSMRRKGDAALGRRTEIKNMNSLSNMVKAMEYEAGRQISLLDEGKTVPMETLRFDAVAGRTEPMRGKEGADDYRYFPEPDVPPILLKAEEVEALRKSLPELPGEKYRRYTEELRLPEADALLLVKYRRVAEYFEEASKGCETVKTAANWILGPLFARISTETEKEHFTPPVSALQLRELLLLLEKGTVSMHMAKRVLEKMLDTGRPCKDFLSGEELSPFTEEELENACRKAIENLPQAAKDYRNGKTKALKALVGAVMRSAGGRASAPAAEALLKRLL